MTMLVGIAMQEIQNLFVVLIASQLYFLKQLTVRHTVNRKHVDIEPTNIVYMHTLYQCGGVILNLAKGKWIIIVILCTAALSVVLRKMSELDEEDEGSGGDDDDPNEPEAKEGETIDE